MREGTKASLEKRAARFSKGSSGRNAGSKAAEFQDWRSRMAENKSSLVTIGWQLERRGLRVGSLSAGSTVSITERLLQRCGRCVGARRARAARVLMWRTCRSFELPLTAKKLATTGKYRCADCHWVHYPRRNRALRLCLLPKRHGFAARGKWDTGVPIMFLCVDVRYAGASRSIARA